eukprot:4299237-Prymnesium_polylepis.1
MAPRRAEVSYGRFVKTPRAAVLELRRTLSIRVRRREGRATFPPACDQACRLTAQAWRTACR